MIQNHAGTIIGVVLLVVLVWVAAATQGAHSRGDVVLSIGAAQSTPVPPTPTPLPTPTPAPDAFAPARWAAANIAVISLMLAIGVALPIGIVLHARHRARLLEPNNPPLRDREAVHRIYDVRSLEARRGWLPESFTFAPHMRNDLPVEVEEPAAALPAPGGVEELLSHGQGLAYGWRVDNGELLVDRQVRSLLIGGVQGSGKTSFAAILLAQLVRMNARVMLGDPDAFNEQGLASRLAGLGVQPEQTAQEPFGVLRLVLNAQHELMTRRDQGAHADPRPYIVVVDEVPECLRVLNRHDSGQLASALELIGGLKGRKHGVAVVMLAQGWSQSVIGSTAMRDLIPTSAVFRMRAEQAERMCGLKPGYWRAVGPDPLDLQPGEFYAVGIDSGAVRVRVPEVSSHSLTRAPAASKAAFTQPSDGLQAAFTPALGEGSMKAGRRLDEGWSEGSPEGQDGGQGPGEQERQIVALFYAGNMVPAIVKTVFGLDSSAGPRYLAKRGEVEGVIQRWTRPSWRL